MGISISLPPPHYTHKQKGGWYWTWAKYTLLLLQTPTAPDDDDDDDDDIRPYSIIIYYIILYDNAENTKKTQDEMIDCDDRISVTESINQSLRFEVYLNVINIPPVLEGLCVLPPS